MHRAYALYAASSGNDEAALIGRYGPMIDRLARRLSMRIGMPATFDDLWSAGALGLLDAAKRYDAARDVKFESFAEHRIRGAMLDELRKMDHLPRRLRAQTDKVAKAKQRLAHELGHEPSTQEIAEALKMDVGEVGEIETLSMPHVALVPELATLSDEAGQDEKMSHAQMLHLLTQTITKLPPRLQTLLSLHYVEGLTYREIAGIMQVSEPRVCQLHSEAVKQMRKLIAEAQGEEIPEPAPSPRGRKPKKVAVQPVANDEPAETDQADDEKPDEDDDPGNDDVEPEFL